MPKPSQNQKPFVFKKLQMTYKEFLNYKKSLIGLKIGKYVVLEKLGQGSFGTVFRAVDEISLDFVAIKVIDLEMIEAQSNLEVKKIQRRLVRSESKMMLKCRSDNLIKCYEVYENDSIKLMVIEYCNEGTLQEKIDKEVRICQNEAIEILKKILNGLIELHKNKIIHRDLKPQNILIHDKVCKIADFGFSKELVSNDHNEQIVQTHLGTPAYMAPQIYQRKEYGLNVRFLELIKADIWSVGVIFFTMLYGKTPFDQLSKQQIDAKIINKSFFDPNSHVKVSSQSQSFITQCLNLDSKKRLNWQNIRKHILFCPSNQPLSSGLSTLSTQFGSFIFQDDINVKQIDEMINISSDDQKAESELQKSTEIQKVRAVLLPSQQFSEIRQKVKKMLSSKEISWPKSANFECLKAEFILEEIIEPLELLPSKYSDSKEITQILFLLLARCLQDLAVKYHEREIYQEKVVPGFMKILQNLYKKCEKKFEIYEEKVALMRQDVLGMIKDKLLGFFGDQETEDKEVFFRCDRRNLKKGKAMGGYSRVEQIKLTQIFLERELQKLEGVKMDKNLMRYGRNYEKIVSVRVGDVGESYFRGYVTNLINE